MATLSKRKCDQNKKNTKYIICWFDAENERWRTTTGYTDKELSLAKGTRLELESQRRREGHTSDVREQSLRPVEEQLVEYLTHIRTLNRGPSYIAQLGQRIRRVLKDSRALRLIDITASKVETALLSLKKSRGFECNGKRLGVTTRNEYLTSITGFTWWAKANRKMEFDSLEGLSKADVKEADRVHPRRALSVDEIPLLLNATLRRPEAELLTVRVGKDKGKLEAKVRQGAIDRAKQKGIDRRMAYLVSIWSGLRRAELRELQWRDVLLEISHPFIQLRADETKSKRADTLGLHAQAVEEILKYRPAKFAPTDRVLREVPSMSVMKKDLAFAGIDYGDRKIGFADLHALRMTLNNMLASQGVDVRTRQSQLRHTDPRLTEVTYFDKLQFIKPQSEKLNQADAIPGISAASQTVLNIKTLPDCAGLAQETRGVSGHNQSLSDMDAEIAKDMVAFEALLENLTIFPEFGTKRHDPASLDTGSLLKRAKGVEPSTFTLAT
jgi:integrase